MNKIPEWLHKPANIDPDRLPQIQEELLSLFEDMKQSYLYSETTMGFTTETVYTKKELLHKIPILARELNRLKILKYFNIIGLFRLKPGLSELPIHIDDPSHTINIALNIPVIGCEDSYTVWYDAEIDYNAGIPAYASDGKYDPGGRMIKGEAKEISRVNCSFPSWVNIARPHQGVYTGTTERINASIRFTSGIYDVIDTDFFKMNLTRV